MILVINLMGYRMHLTHEIDVKITIYLKANLKYRMF